MPAAVGLYSTAFNIFNTALLVPFVGVFERVLSGIGRTSAEDAEDYSMTRFLDRRKSHGLTTGVPLVQQEMARYVEGANLFLAIGRKEPSAPNNAKDHQAALDILSRDIRRYTAEMFTRDMPHAQADLLASLIEEEDFTASLGETLFQVARRVERRPFSTIGHTLVATTIDEIAKAMRALIPEGPVLVSDVTNPEAQRFLASTRDRCLRLGADLPWEERGAILELLGSAERAFFLIDRIDAERRSVPRAVASAVEADVPAVRRAGFAPASS